MNITLTFKYQWYTGKWKSLTKMIESDLKN